MTQKMNISVKSFFALLLSFIILFSIIAPTVQAVTFATKEEAQETVADYEKENHITGEYLDFSDRTQYDFNQKSYYEGTGWKIQKSGTDYQITFHGLVAKKVILPADDADTDTAWYSGKPRKTHITIELIGDNKITGYGLEGTCVKGVTIQGTGNLEINAFSEPKVEMVTKMNQLTEEQKAGKAPIQSTPTVTNYTVPGIRIETGDDKYGNYSAYDDDKSLVFAGTGDIIINSDNYYGITCNGDIKMKSGNIVIHSKKSAISAHRIFVGDEANTDFSLELISQERAFYDRPTFEGNHIIMAGKSAGEAGKNSATAVNKAEMENAYTSYRYVKVFHSDDQKAPDIENLVENKVYCTLPTVTVTDETAIDTITVNGIKVVRFTVNNSTTKTFVIPASSNPVKEIVATDILGNKSTITVKVLGHSFDEWKVVDGKQERSCQVCGLKETKAIEQKKVEKETVAPKVETQKLEEPKVTEQPKQEAQKKETPKVETKVEEKEKIKITNISKAKISLSKVSYTYDGKAKKPTVTVKDGNKVLVNNKDYTVKYTNNINAGTATVTVTGKNDYSGTAKTTFSIQKAGNVITASNFTKTYSSKAQSFSIGAKQAGDAKLTYSSNNKSVTVNSSGKVTIKKGFIGKVTITIKASQTAGYNATTKKITITVNPPSVKISKIKNSSSKKMTVTWAKNTAVTGYKIEYSTDKNFKKDVKTVTVKKNSTTSTTISKLTKGKKYYVRVRTYKTVSGTTYYSSWSAVKNIKISK